MSTVKSENKISRPIIVFVVITLLLAIVIIARSFIGDKAGKQNNNIQRMSNTTDVVEETKIYEIKDLGSIECKKIELNAPIKETTELDVLATAVGHFKDTPTYNGNVCLAGHNSGTNKNGEDVGFFKRLNELEVGDEIIYHHAFGQYFYKVSEISEVEETDLSMLENTTSDRLTLITCIKGQRNLRLCVVCDRI